MNLKCKIFAVALLAWSAAMADGTTPTAQPDTARYLFPVKQVAGLHSSGFGELRPGHFHAGVDIKTDGVEGKPLVAVADGYISRAVITTYGYGRAIYLTLKDGKTVVYGHIQRFRPDLADTLQAARYRQKKSEIDLWFTPEQWPVKRGDVIGYSGNSGSSGGPHLHFEVRSADTRRLNPVREGWLHPADQQPPRIFCVHYVEVDTLQGVCVRSGMADYNIVRTAEGDYRLNRTEPVPVGRRGYFILEASDRRDGVTNTFGIRRLTGFIDGEPYFEYLMDGFRYEDASSCDAVSCYALQRSSRNEVIRMACLDRALPEFYPLAVERGLIRTEPGEERHIRIEVEDDCGNMSSVDFDVRGRAQEFRAQVDSTAVVLSPDRVGRVVLADGIQGVIPKEALYESLFTRAEVLDQPVAQPDSGLVVLSPAMRVLREDIPLRANATVTLQADVPQALRIHTTLAGYTPGKGLRYVGGSYHEGAVTAKTRRTGWMVVVADTLPPRIRPRFKEGADLSRAQALRFAVSDNFSGVSGCRLSVDGRWVPCDRLPMKGLVSYIFDTRPAGRRHEVVFEVSDALGNTSVWKGSYYR